MIQTLAHPAAARINQQIGTRQTFSKKRHPPYVRIAPKRYRCVAGSMTYRALEPPYQRRCGKTGSTPHAIKMQAFVAWRLLSLWGPNRLTARGLSCAMIVGTKVAIIPPPTAVEAPVLRI